PHWQVMQRLRAISFTTFVTAITAQHSGSYPQFRQVFGEPFQQRWKSLVIHMSRQSSFIRCMVRTGFAKRSLRHAHFKTCSLRPSKAGNIRSRMKCPRLPSYFEPDSTSYQPMGSIPTNMIASPHIHKDYRTALVG